jgi:hypothetical protein
MEMLWSHKFYRAVTSICGTLTKVTEWPTVTHSNGGHGSEKKPFFHLLIMTIVSIFLLLTPCGAERTHRNFRIVLVWNLIENAGSLPCPRLPLATSCRRLKSDSVRRKFQQFLAISFLLIWPVSHRRYERECDVGLCIGECFKVYHKRCKLWHIEECW